MLGLRSEHPRLFRTASTRPDFHAAFAQGSVDAAVLYAVSLGELGAMNTGLVQGDGLIEAFAQFSSTHSVPLSAD